MCNPPLEANKQYIITGPDHRSTSKIDSISYKAKIGDVFTKSSYGSFYTVNSMLYIDPTLYTYKLYNPKETTVDTSSTLKRIQELEETMQKTALELTKMKEHLKSQNVLDVPEKGYYIDAAGPSAGHFLKHAGAPNYKEVGNTFDTHKQAQQFAEHYKSWSVLNSRAIVLADGWKPDWNDRDQIKYCMYFNITHNFQCEYLSSTQYPGVVYLPTKEKAQQLANWANENIEFVDGQFKYKHV